MLLMLPAALMALTLPVQRRQGIASNPAVSTPLVLQEWQDTASTPANITREANSLAAKVKKLLAQDHKAHKGSLARTELDQRLKVAQAELNAIKKLIGQINAGLLTTAQAEARLHQLVVRFAKADKALIGLLFQESSTHQASPFTITLRF
jgi:hypothetical protein